MKVALSWLEQYFTDKPNWKVVFDKLTTAGIELEDITQLEDSTDAVIELKITPNRGDCLSVMGLLREISVLTGYKYNYSLINEIIPTNNKPLNVIIDAKDECPVYTAVIIEGVNNQIILPDFITTRLKHSGLRSVSPLVDIGNYVMLETGQPLHIFDADITGNELRVRMANDNESLKLLDDKTVTLNNNTLLICGNQNEPVAMAGVMGSSDSGVTDNTKNIIIESAYFTPQIIVGKTKQYSISSDAAYRFERGVDFSLQVAVLKLVSKLIIKYLGGEFGQIIEIRTPEFVNNLKIVKVDFADFKKIIGVEISQLEVVKILNNLGFMVEAVGSAIAVTVPSFRFDINIKEDIIEEVARVYGYDNITPILPNTNYTMLKINPYHTKTNLLKNLLVSRGFTEIISYSFLENKYAQLFNYTDIKPIELQNSIAGLTHLRTTLFAGLIKSMQYNVNRNYNSLKLFELSRVFYGETIDSQPLKLSGLWYSNNNNLTWYNGNKSIDFFDIKGEVEILLSSVAGVRFVKCTDIPVLHNGRCAKIYSYDKEIGVIGQLHPQIMQNLGIEGSMDFAPYLFELSVEDIIQYATDFAVVPTSRFQKVERDLAFVMDKQIAVGDIIDCISLLGINDVKEVSVFDVFTGGNLPTHEKSVAFKILFQANKTLTDNEIGRHLDQITNCVIDTYKIKLRG